MSVIITGNRESVVLKRAARKECLAVLMFTSPGELG